MKRILSLTWVGFVKMASNSFFFGFRDFGMTAFSGAYLIDRMRKVNSEKEKDERLKMIGIENENEFFHQKICFSSGNCIFFFIEKDEYDVVHRKWCFSLKKTISIENDAFRWMRCFSSKTSPFIKNGKAVCFKNLPLFDSSIQNSLVKSYHCKNHAIIPWLSSKSHKRKYY